MAEEGGRNTTPGWDKLDEGGDRGQQFDLVRLPSIRSEINALNATKHGMYSKEKKLTTELCESLVRSYLALQGPLGTDEAVYSASFAGEPLGQLCPEWRFDAWAMAEYVIARFGARVSRNQKLVRTDETKPWAPDNIAGWYYKTPKLRKRDLRLARLNNPVELLLDCACDHIRQETCAHSPRPCDWAAASREAAPWAEAASLPD